MRLDRRNFLQLSAGFCFASALAPVRPTSPLFADDATDAPSVAELEKLLKLQTFELKIGATQPFDAIHVSDTHLCFADARNDERKLNLAEARSRYFSNGEKYFDAALALARRTGALFLHTGDLIDFVSAKNLDVVKAKYVGEYAFVSSGNHEFSQYVGEAKEDDAYKAQSFDAVQAAYPNDLAFCSRVINGINFVAFDDVYYYVAADLRERFEAEVAKGLPIVAMCHVPFYTPELFDVAMSQPNANCAYVVGVPDERAKEFEKGRFQQQRANETTVEFIEWLKAQPLLKAILCGHLHYDWSGQFSETATQYVVGGNFIGAAYRFKFC